MGKRLIQLSFDFLLESTTVVKCLTGRGHLIRGNNSFGHFSSWKWLNLSNKKESLRPAHCVEKYPTDT